MAVAKIYAKVVGGTTDNTLILGTRSQLVYPFSAPNWTDLRVGFFLSVTKNDTGNPADDDTITGLAEPLTTGGPPTNLSDYSFIGVKTNNDAQSGSNVGFIGYSTYSSLAGFDSDFSELCSSDAGIGTGTTFWRPRITHPTNDSHSAIIMDTGGHINAEFTNVQPHFPQVADGTSTHPYATLLMLRLTRPNSTSHAITVQIKQGTNSSDVLFTNTPTLDLLEQNLSSYPTMVQTKSVNNMANIPDAIYAYWPFHQSRLRISALGFMKYR